MKLSYGNVVKNIYSMQRIYTYIYVCIYIYIYLSYVLLRNLNSGILIEGT